jgi:hypothetical protein
MRRGLERDSRICPCLEVSTPVCKYTTAVACLFFGKNKIEAAVLSVLRVSENVLDRQQYSLCSHVMK